MSAAPWGILLADTARHVADAIAEETGADPREVAAEIRDQFIGEFDRPTAKTKGAFLGAPERR